MNPPRPRRNEPRFDIDVKKGDQGELQIGDFLQWIAAGNGRVEVKTKSYLDLELYIEQEKDPGARGRYVPGGINETTAHVWCFVIGETGIHLAIPTDILREAVTWPTSRPKECNVGSCPTRGMLVNFGMLLRHVKQQHIERGVVEGDRPITRVDPPSTITHRDIPWGGSR